MAALVFAALALVWLVGGDRLPGGRWLAVHLLTLGVVSNLVLGFSRHFAETLTRVPAGAAPYSQLVGFNSGVATVMVGMVAARPVVVGIGATVATSAVLVGHRRIRRSRQQALGARFAWIVRCYERAHGAFVHGAILGALMGTGVLAGRWYGAARIAHLHVNLLGWAGLTLLATIVFFGPTMARTRIESGADARAARQVPVAGHAVTVAALALLGSGAVGSAGDVLRMLAGVALGVFAWVATATCRGVVRAVAAAPASTAPMSSARGGVAAVCRWLPLLAWADAVVVLVGAWANLPALGLGLLVGVLAQAIVTTLVYLAPMLVAGRDAAREAVRAALGRWSRVRTVVFNVGAGIVVAMALAGTAAGPVGAVLARSGWALVAVAVLQPVVTTAVVARSSLRSRPGSGRP
ncbi:hypothetical protein [Salsipaludibacter albus]|uniref:hypothetical protein n=1 Tax=Salsipaludibacter albus TaxID=2849650 RepID=UPI001EE4EB20|nr:hypothetical protein [Salsipaludibacter albus]MBY5163937.1 hypothetical protein [Salsipaludibacter albus]